jgi:transposase-like protein
MNRLPARFRMSNLGGIVLERTWAGEVRNVSVLVAIGVDEDGFRKVLGVPRAPRTTGQVGARFCAI